MFYTIYKTTNLINQRFYIGMHRTQNLNDKYLGSGLIIEQAITKYGKENFKKDIMYVYNTEIEMVNKEKEIVTKDFCKREETYNICVGGYGGNLTDDYDKAGQLESKLRKIEYGFEMIEQYLQYIYMNSIFNFEITKPSPFKLHQVGSRNSQYGTVWITNGTFNKKIKKNQEIPEGWRRGKIATMKEKNAGNNTNKLRITNDINIRYASEEDAILYINLGYRILRK